MISFNFVSRSKPEESACEHFNTRNMLIGLEFEAGMGSWEFWKEDVSNSISFERTQPHTLERF